MSLAIATTILSPASNFIVWLDFHLRRCALILIYLDDPSKRIVFEQLCKNRPVNIFDGATDEPAMSRPNRLLLRQSSNLKYAISHLLDHRAQLGVEWLLHIDQDEILYENGETSWQTNSRLGHVTFTNHEAIPLQCDTQNAFEDCVWFNMNGPLAEPFMAYGNGKSAVRLSDGVEPDGAHRFKSYEADAITLPDNRVEAASGTTEQAAFPVLLHYPYPSFESWRAKFCLYGEFSDYWLDDKKYPNKLDFMLQSRDKALSALAAQERGDSPDPWAEAQQFFAARIFSGESLQSRVRDGRAGYYAPLGDHNKECEKKTAGRGQLPLLK